MKCDIIFHRLHYAPNPYKLHDIERSHSLEPVLSLHSYT
jgi:hypothetical protein